jgi:hypothetical protein
VINSHLLSGASLFLTNRTPFEREFWRDIGENRVTTMPGVPFTYDVVRRAGGAEHVLFSDRRSLAALSLPAYDAMDGEARNRLAEAFFVDSFTFDQMACSSPRLLAWIGEGDVPAGRRRLLRALARVADRRGYDLPLGRFSPSGRAPSMPNGRGGDGLAAGIAQRHRPRLDKRRGHAERLGRRRAVSAGAPAPAGRAGGRLRCPHPDPCGSWLRPGGDRRADRRRRHLQPVPHRAHR